jgi:hypothetical protein
MATGRLDQPRDPPRRHGARLRPRGHLGRHGDISRVTPLLARVYPNGEADVNQFHAAGGMAFVVRELIDAVSRTRT